MNSTENFINSGFHAGALSENQHVRLINSTKGVEPCKLLYLTIDSYPNGINLIIHA